MATLNEIAYDLLTIVRPQLSDDTEIDLRQVKFWINNQRALWVRNELNKKRSIDSDLVQTLCVELECVDASDCCDVDLDVPILRSTKKIPDPIEMHSKQAIVRVGPLNKKAQSFSHVEYERVPYVGNSRFNKNLVFSFMHDGYLYIATNNSAYGALEAVSLRGVFEDPTEAAEFKDCSGSGDPCYTDDSNYPIKAWMIPAMKEAILKSNLMIQAQAEVQAADTSNDANSNVEPNV
jgi:hypothetical protein